MVHRMIKVQYIEKEDRLTQLKVHKIRGINQYPTYL
ncbi:unnamed protein product [Schistosoma margrebowiei]|uniref:Uncharacterized protein n=1 Tax=Schistosoma margrebowiei TaxID=48269 RepID=A0A3P7ZPB7_9TREM|nr:unnamed protein product [Schistosoma margrebowiei]